MSEDQRMLFTLSIKSFIEVSKLFPHISEKINNAINKEDSEKYKYDWWALLNGIDGRDSSVDI